MVNPQHGNPNGGDNLETGSFPSYVALLLQQATWPFGASVFLSSGAIHLCLFVGLRGRDGRGNTGTDQKHPLEREVEEHKCLQRFGASVHAVF